MLFVVSRNFRGGRGGGRPRSLDSQGQAGEQGQDAPRGPPRPRYRRRGPLRPRGRNSQSQSESSGNQQNQAKVSIFTLKVECSAYMLSDACYS